nr:hypothetical protein CFP56_73969 [Quercus suber]
MGEPNVTTHYLENQECGTSSSHVEPTNGGSTSITTKPWSICKPAQSKKYLLGKEMSQHKVSQHPNVKEYIEVNQHLRLDLTKLQEVTVLEYQ